MRALEIGVRLFAVDCEAEVDKIVRAVAATGAEDVKVFCRQSCATVAGAEWPLSRKFGCAPEMAVDVLEHAASGTGLRPTVSPFMSARSSRNTEAWDQALASSAAIFRECTERGIRLLHGQSRRRLPDAVPQRASRRSRLMASRSSRPLSRHFGNRIPETIIEPGRGMVGNAGVIDGGGGAGFAKEAGPRTKSAGSISDIGKFGGLAENHG